MQTFHQQNSEAVYPISWYQVAWSHELKPLQIKSLTVCDRDLIVYRAQDGSVHALDAYCPHLGAHLGVKGKVCGNQIRCAFHGWQFDGDGRCQKISSEGKITPNMNTRAWRVIERYGIIFVHFDPNKTAHNQEFIEISLFDGKKWGKPIGRAHHIHTRQSDVLENGVDMEHFNSVHGVPMNGPELTEKPNGNLSFRHQTVTKRLGIQFNTMMEIAYVIPGLQTIHLHSVLGRECITLSSVTPVHGNYVIAHLTTRVRETKSSPTTPIITRALSHFINSTFAQDIPIWNAKVYKNKPVLAQGDDGIHRFRKWYNRFPTVS
ncbi:MAG: aromatic ring-hydroxylating dioxygenase subunit alpha [Myxococcales bacterium]|nr:aromatic ring-hydroxylating dioxygenase subunit alpha [Myxococcales bacterium]USN50996.1 MAG: aromatic ring-hydroxylating dioxygenase subunit alpha [Myxococcales bacterium]